MFSIGVEIHDCTIILPDSKIKSKKFYIEVETDEKVFRTDPKPGNNLFFGWKESTFSKKGVITFKLVQKGGMLGKDITIGTFHINIHMVNCLKVSKILDFQNKKKVTVGSLKIVLKLRSKGNGADQGSEYEINSDASYPVSLEEEEDEEEEYNNAREITQSEENSIYESNPEEMKMIAQNTRHTEEDQNEAYPPNDPNMYARNQFQEFGNLAGEMEDSDEEPVPDDEDRVEVEIEKPSSRNPEYPSENNPKRSRNHAFTKKNFRSTSHKDKRLNFHKKTFQSRKSSNRLIKDSFTPQIMGSKRAASRNNHNMSHALTQYSPTSYKDKRFSKKRGKRMIPSQSYGPSMKMHSRHFHPYKRKKARGMYTPLAANFMQQRFSTFDQDFCTESEEESVYATRMIDPEEFYYDFERESIDGEKVQSVMNQLYNFNEMLMKKSEEIEIKQNQMYQLYKQVSSDKKKVEDERIKVEMIRKEISQGLRLLKRKIEQAKRLGLKQNNSTFFKNLEVNREDKHYSEYAVDNITSDHAFTEMEEGSPLPSMTRPNHGNKMNYYQNVSELNEGSQNLQKRFAEDFDVNMQKEQNYQMEDQNYEEMENYPPKNSNRNLAKEFNQHQERNEEEKEYVENLNRSYESEPYPNYSQTQQVQNRNRLNNQNYAQLPPKPSDFQKPQEERKPRFNNEMQDQNQYYYDMRRSQERQNYQNQTQNQNTQNFGNSYYDVNQNMAAKSPVVNNYPQNTGNINPPFVNQEMNGENQMNYNHPYQPFSYNGAPYGEMSFNKDFSNPNNIMSGSSTDRFGNKNQVQNYMTSTQNPVPSNGPNSAYNSVPANQDPPLNPSQLKSEFVQPPTFHPVHQLQNSSHLNSQNSTHTPPQITPKQGISKFHNFEQMNQMQVNPNKPFSYEQFRELEQQNSFSIRDRNQGNYTDFRDSSIENNTMDQQRMFPNQISRITGTQDSRAFNSIREQQEQEEENLSTPKTAEDQEKEEIKRKIKELEERFQVLNMKSGENENQNPQNMDVLQPEDEQQLNLKTDLEKYMNKDDQNEINDPENYIKNNLEKNEKVREEIKQQRRLDNDKLVENELINKLVQSKQQVHQTPEKRVEGDDQENYVSEKEGMPGLPSHITGSMRKIRNSPALADNEREHQLAKENEDSPNSIIPNTYGGKDDTVCRVNKDSFPPVANIDLDIQASEQEEEGEEFKPNPDILAQANANMRKNDEMLNFVGKFKETDEQKKKREEREKIEKERQQERERLYFLMSNGIDFGGSDYYEEDQEDQSEHENISINSMTEQYQNTRKEDEKEQETKQLKVGERGFNSQHNENEPQLHHSSLNPCGTEMPDPVGLDDLEMVEDDPLERKRQANEAISKIEQKLDDMDSLMSDSNQNSAMNTIDQAKRELLKTEIARELFKKRNKLQC